MLGTGAVGGGDDKKDDEEATAKDEEAAQALADQRREEEEARREKHRMAEEEREGMRAQIRKKVLWVIHRLATASWDSDCGLELILKCRLVVFILPKSVFLETVSIMNSIHHKGQGCQLQNPTVHLILVIPNHSQPVKRTSTCPLGELQNAQGKIFIFNILIL